MNTRFAQILSYLFHPVIYPLLGTFTALQLSSVQIPQRIIWFSLALVFVGTYVFPLLISFGLYKLGFIKSLEMHTRAERRLPYLVGGGCYYLTSLFIKNLPLPEEAFLFLMASALVILVHLISFVYLKSSAHLGSIGGFTALLMVLSLKFEVFLLFHIAFCFLIAGFVASARLQLNAHKPSELLFGYISGFAIVALTLAQA